MRSDCPDALSRLKAAADGRVQKDIDEGKDRRLSFTQTTYAHDDVRTELDRLQHEKCAYCETRLRPATLGDIEHFRPKGEVQDEDTGERLFPGYYWLAHDWPNLLVACNWCNTKAKGTRFPVVHENQRQRLPLVTDVVEQPLLLNPYLDRPRAWLRFDNGYIYAVDDDPRANKTIDVLQLHREDLNKARRRSISIVQGLLHTARTAETPEDRQEARDLVIEYFSEAGEYASCINDRFDFDVMTADWRGEIENLDERLGERPVAV